MSTSVGLFAGWAYCDDGDLLPGLQGCRQEMNRKLPGAILAAALIAAVVVYAPLIFKKFATANDEPGQPTISLADLATGSFIEVELRSSRVFVLRDFDNEIYVFSVPYSDSAYWLPEFDWSHPAVPCAQFEPDNKEDMLIPGGKFRCVLPDHGEFFRYEHSWSYSGDNHGYRTSDMKVADHEITDDSIVLLRWE